MAILIGTDEAGYGPNLGPLTICGSLWKTEGSSYELYRLLCESVSAQSSDDKIFLADSKLVYQSKGSLQQLETSVLSLLTSMTGSLPSTWESLASILGLSIEDESDIWLKSSELKLPLSSQTDRIHYLADQIWNQLQNSPYSID